MIKVSKKKQYYSLSELGKEVDLKSRALKYRMLYVKEKYKNRIEKLHKKGRAWRIHESIIWEFDRKKKTKHDNEFDKQTLVTIAPDGNYDKEALFEVVKETYNQLKHIRTDLVLRYYIEQGERGELFHVHFIVNLSKRYSRVVKRAAQHYVAANVDVRDVYLERPLIKYLQKEVREKGILSN